MIKEHKEARTALQGAAEALSVRRLNADTRHRSLADGLRQARTQPDDIGSYVRGRKAQAGTKPFDYDRALNQISAVIGLRPGEEFQHDEPDYQETLKRAQEMREGAGVAPSQSRP